MTEQTKTEMNNGSYLLAQQLLLSANEHKNGHKAAHPAVIHTVMTFVAEKNNEIQNKADDAAQESNEPSVLTEDSLPVPPPIQSYSTASGMWAAMSAFLYQIQAVQGYDTTLVVASASLQNTAEIQSQYWIKILSNGGTSGQPIPADATWAEINAQPPGYYSDQAIINWISAQKPGDATSEEMQDATSTLNVHNTLYNQSSSFWSGMNNTTNENSSNALQAVQIALQEYAQGPQSQMQTVASIL